MTDREKLRQLDISCWRCIGRSSWEERRARYSRLMALREALRMARTANDKIGEGKPD